MIVYWTPLLIAVLNCFVRNKKANMLFALVCFIYMMLLSGLRDVSVGTDTFRYVGLFRGEISTDKTFEFVFLWLIRSCRSLFDNYPGFLLLLSALIYIPFFLVASKEISNAFKFFLLLFVISNNLYFIDSFNAVRQLISTSFLFISFMYLKRRKFIPFFVIFVLAFGFHNSALFFLPFILLSMIKIKEATAYLMLVFAVVFSLFGSLFLTREMLFNLLDSISFLGINHYSHYLLFSDYSMGFNVIGLTKLVIIPAIVCGICFKYSNDLYSRIYLWGIVFLSLLSPIIAISSRASMGLTVAELIVVPHALRQSKRGSRDYMLLVGYLVLYSLLMCYSLVVEYSSPEELGPYSFFTL